MFEITFENMRGEFRTIGPFDLEEKNRRMSYFEFSYAYVSVTANEIG